MTDSGGKTGSASSTITVGSAAPNSQVVPSGVTRIGAAPGSLLYTGLGVGVGILDGGIDFDHADLEIGPECFTAFGVAPGGCQDDGGHGTHVAGIVAAVDNTIDVVGVAPGATVYAVKVLDGGSGTDADIIGGLDWVATNGALLTPPIRVVNMSLGRPAAGAVNDAPLRIAVAALHNAGISVVVSAGNNANVEAADNVPAGFPEVMAVASTTALAGGNPAKGQCSSLVIEADTASYFTTDGQFNENRIGVTISAPGERQEDIRKGCFIFSDGILSLALGGGTTRMSGTSMSAPHVAGVVALMWDQSDENGGGLDPELARDKIRSTAGGVGVSPLNSPTGSYTYDGEREGVLDAAAGALIP